MNEVAIGLTVPGFAVELARQRLSPAYFSRAVVTGEMLGPAEAAAAGFVDRVVPAADLERAASDAAEALSGLDLAAHHATKMRARGVVVAAMRSLIDAELGEGYGEERVAGRAAPA